MKEGSACDRLHLQFSTVSSRNYLGTKLEVQQQHTTFMHQLLLSSWQNVFNILQPKLAALAALPKCYKRVALLVNIANENQNTVGPVSLYNDELFRKTSQSESQITLLGLLYLVVWTAKADVYYI